MRPEQMRAARAVLNWTLDRLAEASSVHRNTLSNFETYKYAGEPEKVSAAKRALEAAGAIFTEENGEAAGVRLRRFRVGDRVKFRPQSRWRSNSNIRGDEVGTIVRVEPHPPATGPTYRVDVEFPGRDIPRGIFSFEFELVEAAPGDTEAPDIRCRDKIVMSDPKAVIAEFCTICESVSEDYDLCVSLFETDQRTFDLCMLVAPKFFTDLNRILIEHLFLQFSKITDPAGTGKSANLTTNYILEKLCWPDDVRQKLQEINKRLMTFRGHIESARSKRIAHVDLSAQIARSENLGVFPKGADKQFLQDLQSFVNLAHGHYNCGASHPIFAGMSTDTHQLLRALEESVIFNRCSKCTEADRTVAVVDYVYGG